MYFLMQIMHTREQCIFNHLELRSYRLKSELKNLKKYEKTTVLSTLQLFVEEKVLTCYFSCNFVSKKGTLFLKWVSETINCSRYFFPVSMEVH